MKFALEDEVKELQEWAKSNIVLHPDVKIDISYKYNTEDSREEYFTLITVPDGKQLYLAQYVDNTMRANFESMKSMKKIFVPGIKRTIADLLMNYKSKNEIESLRND